MLNNIKMALFDLDGTLVHSLPDLTLAVNATLLELGLPEYLEPTIATWVGNGSRQLLKRALTGEMEGEPDPDQLEHVMPLFFKHYEDNLSGASHAYSGVEQTLAVLQDAGIKMACVTNKPEKFAHILLQRLKLEQYFPVIVGGGTVPQLKPDPAPLLYACEQLGAPSRYAADYGVMIGDSASDMRAATAVGMPAVAVSYGYAQGKDLRQEGAAHIIDSMPDLIPLLVL